MTDCDPLWPDDWADLDDDEQAFLDLHATPTTPLAECARPASRPDLPRARPVHDVLETL
ncbi:hypothetical protein ACIQKB_04005 [Streptomyces sp. NPDC092046]|uniref:hypothetical protein n=1 Tax=Streptomyces sp. NPDC092046 TaxID=3366009 RepID=UPI0038186617